ncbi:MAG: DUF2064 domain-containing protein [Planctomycetota bacterium]|nr:MAG: DUF2064 domain-containing protein [Planctomycetota bacterium]
MSEAEREARQGLVVMARHPEAGRCKTRLIPRLGPDGAAAMHADLARHTLQWARQVRAPDTAVEVHFTGGSAAAMAEIFGADLDWVPQSDGDLGDRLKAVVYRAAARGWRRLLIVGTDCPELSAAHAEAAWAALDHHHIVLQPATDGGYVLLGLRLPTDGSAGAAAVGRGGDSVGAAGDDDTLFDLEQVCQRLFVSVDWGTDRVLEQTIVRLAELPGLRLRLMAPLNDVDYPEDLPVWDRVQAGGSSPPPALAVIIPVYGHEPDLPAVLDSAAAESDVEIIVVGAEAMPEAVLTCARQGAQFIAGRANRGRQLNCGAKAATAARLLFLHADTRLPTGYASWVIRELDRPEVTIGAFALRIDSPRWAARLVELGVALRSRLFQLPYGDQALFCRKRDFQRLGGFRELPLMEDFEFIHRARRMGRISVLHQPVTTSPRRWHRLGFLRTTWLNQAIVLAYRCGVSPERLARWYRGPERGR